MSSPARLAANRRNAARSTGPRTPRGQRRSSLNALKHGILSRQLVAVDTPADQALFRALHRSLVAELYPVGVVEILLVERIASCLWRLRRVTIAECQAIEMGPSASRGDDGALDMLYRAIESQIRAGREDPALDSPYPTLGMSSVLPYPTALPTPDRLALYSRYEAALERHLYRAFDRLLILQAARTPSLRPPPASPAGVLATGVSVPDPPGPP
jgi:hypothetical protein